MKYHQFYLFCILLVFIGGCDYLNYDESTQRTKGEIFSNYDRTKDFLTNIYAQLPEGFNSIGASMRASASDDAKEIQSFAAVQRFNDGSWSAVRPLDNVWGDMYSGIRAVNRFLEEIKGQSFEDRRFNDDYEQMMEQFRLYPYEARFLRAYFYFELIKRYNDVPLITRLLKVGEANSVKPSTYAEITDFIVNECNIIIPHLPINFNALPNQEIGRVTRGAAMALKARVLLYEASPLHNPSGDIEKWERAAQAAKAIIDSSWYSLENNYSNVTNNFDSSELIFGRRNDPSNSFERNNFPIGFEGAQPRGTAPTQNLVDAYEMQSTGQSINESGSGYNSGKPYTGRDPRLEQTIIINNSTWKGQTVEIWDGGQNGPPQEGATETGYYLKKNVIESISLSPTNTTSNVHTWILFRYGEILLNYAEAMNQAYGPDDPAGMGMTAREAVNQIRARAGMPAFPAGMSQDEFREKLRNERRVELAFEDHRFWDIRRWQIGGETTAIYGMEITRSDNGSFNYQRRLIEERVWEERMNLYPIPQSELFKNEALEQNSGW